ILPERYLESGARSAEFHESAPIRLAVAIDVFPLQIEIMDDLLSSEHPGRPRSRTVATGIATPILGESGWDATSCRGMESSAVIGVEMAEGGTTKPHRPFKHRVEYGREVTRRGVDDLQHFGSRRLLVERLAQRVLAFLADRHVGHGANQP